MREPPSSQVTGRRHRANLARRSGASGGRAAVMGQLPEPVSTEREVHAFVESLLSHGQIEFHGGQSQKAAISGAG